MPIKPTHLLLLAGLVLAQPKLEGLTECDDGCGIYGIFEVRVERVDRRVLCIKIHHMQRLVLNELAWRFHLITCQNPQSVPVTVGDS